MGLVNHSPLILTLGTSVKKPTSYLSSLKREGGNMIFSASWFPEMSIKDWGLQGAEVIIEKPLLPALEVLVGEGILISAHSPMNVQIGSVKPGVRYLSTDIICKNLQQLHQLQPGKTARVVVHAASFSGRTSEEVHEVQRKSLWSLWYKMKEKHLLDNSLICIENLGKIAQVGELDDIIKMCRLTDNFVPCIDFGHLYGRSLGKAPRSKEEFQAVFATLLSGLPTWKINTMHIHFSKLLYGDSGEIKHTTFHDKEGGPKPANFVRALASMPEDFRPVIVCESRESQRDGIQLRRNFEARSGRML
jgi:deoxyribonuclease-4